ncbi:MAG: carboxypeptidase-like regulatory domain-containing protein, partial [Chloroflexi bacterium]|nr:carboxypeptidase-like regulatory domain-containing protein [Chloroflexota bacterium]
MSNPGGRPIDPETGNPMSVRDITQYGASIVRANIAPGTRYWKIIDAYHLSGQQNKGNHNIFVDMLNADGSRRNGAQCTMYVGDKQFTNTIDKPANEPGTNFPIYRGPRYDVDAVGMPSDKAVGFSTDYPDEEAGNTNGHHSYMVIFQETVASGGAQVGIVSGVVNNGAGMSVNLSGNVSRTAPVAGDGTFTFTGVVPGTYNVSVVGTSVATSVVVTAGQTANVTLTLPPSDGGDLQKQIQQLQQQVAQLQQQVAQLTAERDKYR